MDTTNCKALILNISIVIPAYNEKESVVPIYETLNRMLTNNNELIPQYEIIFVNDGSTDGTVDEILNIEDRCVKLISLPEQSGKSAALATGFMEASFDIIVTLDSDLQDDPFDIPGMLLKLDEGYDCVCGWRHKKGSGIIKSISSIIANFVRSNALKDGIHDSNSPLKVIKKSVLEDMFFFNGFHRFIPYLAIIEGFKVCEVKVEQHPRQFGKSKYDTVGRLSKTVCDLFVMVWFKKNRIRVKGKLNLN